MTHESEVAATTGSDVDKLREAALYNAKTAADPDETGDAALGKAAAIVASWASKQ